MTINEIKDKRNKLYHDAQAILLDTPDAEKRTSAQKMLTDADALETDITSLERIEKLTVEERSKTTPNRPNPGAIETATADEKRMAAEKRAFSDYIRFGKVDPANLTENRDVTTSSGAQFIPQAFYPVLTEAQKFYGNILNIVDMVDVDTGAPRKYASSTDVSNLLVVIGQATGVSELDPTIGGATISSDFLTTSVVKVTLNELRDSAFDLEAWVRKAFGIRYYRGLSSMVTNGNSSNIGSLKSGATVGATSAAPTAIAWADVVATFAALDVAYLPDAKWSMSLGARSDLLSVTDSLGRPLYIPAPTADTFDMILGHSVVLNPFMDTVAATNIPILFGDHSAYKLFNVKPGLSIARLNELYYASGEIGFVGYATSGGALLQSSIPPIVSLQMHA